MSSFLSSAFRSPSPSAQDDTTSAPSNISFQGPFVSSLSSTLRPQLASALGSGGESLTNKHGKILFFLHDVDTVCTGQIGNSTRVCCKLGSECKVGRHKTHKVDTLKPGYYIKTSDYEISTTLYVPSYLVNSTLGQELLDTEFKPKQLNAMLQILNQQETPGELDFKTLKEKLTGLTEGAVFKTPAVKRRKVNTLESNFKAMTESWDTNSAYEILDEQQPVAERITEFGNFVVECLTKDEIAICGLVEQIELIRTSIGDEQNETRYTNLWTGIQELQELIKTYTSQQQVEAIVNTNTSALKSDLIALNNDAQSAFAIVESKIMNLEASVNKPKQSNGFLSSTLGGNNSQTSMLQKELALLQEQVKALGNAVTPARSTSDNKEVVTVGQYTFGSIQDLSAWADVHMPSSFPFGGFVDVYSYLERVNSFKDVASSTVLKSMEIRQKLDLTADEAVIIESFKHALPRIFNGGSSSSSNSSFTSWLPGIPTKDKWEDNVGLSGAKVTIRDNEASIRTRVEEVITQRLSGHAEAQSLARILLSDTITFVSALNRFITETYKRLEESGFGKTDSWKLVSKLVHRMFATDCYHRRGAVSEFLDASDARTLSLGVLWGTLSTHQIMREYMSYGIENHPSISSEYVRFLVANCGLERIQKLETDNQKLAGEVAELKKTLAANTKTMSTLANKADEALKLAKKRPRQEQA